MPFDNTPTLPDTIAPMTTTPSTETPLPTPTTTGDIVLSQEATNRLVGGLRGWAQENWQNTVVDIRQLSPQLRYLTIFGYGTAVCFLLLVLFFEIAGDFLPHISVYYDKNGATNLEAVLSPLVLLLYSLSRTIGWALILTGASDCRRRIFLPVVAVFSMEYLLSTILTGGENVLLGLLQTGVFVAIVIIIIVFAIAPRLAVFQKFPLLEFVMWFSLLLIHTVSTWLNAGSWQLLFNDINANVLMSVMLATPFWIWLGIDGASLIRENSYYVTRQIQQRVSLSKLPWVALGLAVLPIPFYLVSPDSIGPSLALLCDFVLIPLTLIGVLFFFLRPRGYSLSRLLLWVVVTVLLYSFFVGLAYSGGNLTEIVVGATGIIPPTTLFALLFLYDIAGFGTHVASVDGKWFPRSARLLLYLGAITIASGFTLLIFNVQDPVTHDPVSDNITVINAFVFLSLFFFSPLYLIRALWKDRKAIMADPFAAVAEASTVEEPAVEQTVV